MVTNSCVNLLKLREALQLGPQAEGALPLSEDKGVAYLEGAEPDGIHKSLQV